jgi:hypothetical protein
VSQWRERLAVENQQGKEKRASEQTRAKQGTGGKEQPLGKERAGRQAGAGFFLPTVEFLQLRSCNGLYRSNSNFKPKLLETASSNGMERYTAVYFYRGINYLYRCK